MQATELWILLFQLLHAKGIITDEELNQILESISPFTSIEMTLGVLKEIIAESRMRIDAP